MSDSVPPHRWQCIRLPRPWDSPGKNTGVGCHFLLQCMKVKSESEVTQLCLTLSDPMDCSLPGSSVHGIFQSRVLEWGATAFSVMCLLQLLISQRSPVGKVGGVDYLVITLEAVWSYSMKTHSQYAGRLSPNMGCRSLWAIHTVRQWQERADNRNEGIKGFAHLASFDLYALRLSTLPLHRMFSCVYGDDPSDPEQQDFETILIGMMLYWSRDTPW